MVKSAKIHKENSNIIKEIRASTDAAIRNQGASIKTLEIQIGQMSKVLQERGIGGGTFKVKILETYDHTLPQKEKDIGSFTLPCFIHDICFDKALVDLGASVSVMPFSTYSNLGLGFSIIDDVDITSGVVLGMPFCKRFESCQMIMERFAHRDECKRMDE
ncbi:hypothetical protein Tco_0526906 [Tanacetum coccineum]